MSGKVVLVTGASRGIGAAVARRLASEGDKLALVGLEPEELRQVAEECGPDAGWWEADVTDLASLQAAVDAVVERYGRIDVVVANAGIAAPGFTRSMDPAVFERVLDVDLYGVWRTVRVTLPHLLASKGYLLLVSSLAAVVHIPGLASYTVAKAGVEAMGNSLRAELRHLGVKVGVAHMTFVDTDMVRGVDEHPVFGKVRTGIPLANRVYPLDFAVEKFVRGIRRRSRVVHVPGWIGPLKAVRALIPHVVEFGSRLSVAKADRAALADIETRGATVSTRASGAGGQADSAKVAQR
ncbi:NADP-dependent 3-hydroxy acid dehydrogenase YdfG [Kribbella amoyensis]|uniref:NADP-dependent 3-hydroxy acid dehydrogenase YdfG n=1 Tax=Kribbella amoyensis TaxID=996641 RepID=A0A561BZH7_9ACTN|nr:SDR family oxidoreductase [Kribbella amoyensis]TWD84082.1 NADP-dependent 3-hydroxy acid dehydrogenase YdfG [Kribbella amoyensis]